MLCQELVILDLSLSSTHTNSLQPRYTLAVPLGLTSMSDGTSSGGSYSYECESQHWEFGHDDFYDADDSQLEDNCQLFPPHGDSSVAGPPRSVQDAH